MAKSASQIVKEQLSKVRGNRASIDEFLSKMLATMGGIDGLVELIWQDILALRPGSNTRVTLEKALLAILENRTKSQTMADFSTEELEAEAARIMAEMQEDGKSGMAGAGDADSSGLQCAVEEPACTDTESCE